MLLSDGTGTPPLSGLSCGWMTSALMSRSRDPARDAEETAREHRGEGDRQVAPPSASRRADQPEAGEVEAHAEEREEREDGPPDGADPFASDHAPREEREEDAVRDASRRCQGHRRSFDAGVVTFEERHAQPPRYCGSEARSVFSDW